MSAQTAAVLRRPIGPTTLAPTPSRPVAGTARLTRHALRVDRITVTAWAVSVGLIAGLIGITFERLYPTTASRLGLQKLADSPVLRVILGPLLAPTSTGGLVAWRMGSIMVIVLGLATTFTVVRRTRAEEQHDRGMLVLAAPVGRAAPVTSALAVAAVLDGAAATTIALAMLALGQPAGGAVLLGAVVGASAWSLGCAAAVVAQVASTSKGANGAAAALVAVAFLLRALGELTAGWLLWVNPLAWVAKAAPFADARPWVVALPIAAGAALGSVAAWGATVREFGTGLIPARPHPSRPVGATPLALAWRLERVSVAVTIGAAACYSVAIGSVVGLFTSFIKSSPQFEQFLVRLGGTHVLEDAFTTSMAIFGAIAISGWAVSMVLRLHAEEVRGRVTVLVAGAATRDSVFGGFSATAIGSAVVGLLCFGAGLGVGRAAVDRHLGSFSKGLAAGAVTVPAALVLVAVAMLAVGASARTAPLAWAGVVWCAIVAVIGSFLGVPRVVVDTSPFWHVPAQPLHGAWWVPCVLLLAVSALIMAVALVGFRRRELGAA